MIKSIAESTEEEFDRVFDANAKGVFFTLQETARNVRDGGRIVVVSSGGTRMLMSGTGLYLGSKGAVEQFVRVLSPVYPNWFIERVADQVTAKAIAR